MNRNPEQVEASNSGAAVEIESLLLDFLRKSEADLNTRASIKSARSVLSELIERWNFEHPLASISEPESFREVVLRNLIGFGPLEPLLEDESVWEISVNGPKEIFVKSHLEPPRRHLDTFHDSQHLERVLGRMLETSRGSTRQLDPSLGIQDAQLPDGTRLHIVHPELTNNYSFSVSIRKFARNSRGTVADFVESGTISAQGGDFLFRAITHGATVLISGAPGTGKTTLLNALIDALPDTKRIVVIEETPEIKVSKPDYVQLHTRPQRLDRSELPLRDLVKASLRMSAEVLVLGEVRDRESLALLLSLSTGIQGMSTIHGSNCKEALGRLRLLVQLALDSTIPIWAINQIIANSIDIVVQLQRMGSRVIVQEIIAIEEGSKEIDSGFVTTEVFTFVPQSWTLQFSGHNPLRLSELKVNRELSENLGQRPNPTRPDISLLRFTRGKT